MNPKRSFATPTLGSRDGHVMERLTSGTSFQPMGSSMRLPEELDEPGILVGWSLEHQHRRQPIGFSFGSPDRSPETGYIDPILLEGDGHLVTIAPTGAGKGVGCIIPTLLRYPGPVIVVDPKGENAAITARRRQELGQAVHVLDPMGITNLTSARLNPLDLVDPEHPLGVDDAVALADAMMLKSGDARDQFWVNRARQLLTGIILHVVCDLPAEMRTMGTVRDVVNRMVADPRQVVSAFVESRHPEVRAMEPSLRLTARETLGGIFAFVQEAVDFVRGPMVRAVLEQSTIEIDAITRGEPVSIYLVLPPHMLETHGRLLRLWISSLLTAVTRRRRRPPLSTLFLLDEAAQLGPLPALRQAITLLRGYGLQTWTFWQDATQLKQLYPSDWPTMINNCRVVQCFGANSMLGARDMAGLVGYSDPNTVLDLEADEMLLQIAGDEAVIAKRPDYRSDPVFNGMYDANPFHDATRDVMPPARAPLRWYLRPQRAALDVEPMVDDFEIETLDDHDAGDRVTSPDETGQ